MAKDYIPDRGELVWLEFDPQAGREQAGHRPGLILSPKPYNNKTGLALCCPITSQEKGYPFEVPLDEGLPVRGVVLADHVRSVDWRIRKARRVGQASPNLVRVVAAKVMTLLP
jgi:mRNA interferase MazF